MVPVCVAHICSLDRDAMAWTRLQRGGQGRDVKPVMGMGRGAGRSGSKSRIWQYGCVAMVSPGR